MLTKKQKEFLDKLKEIVKSRGYFPSVRDIGKEVGLSSSATVHVYLHRLLEKGFLTRNGRYWELFSKFSSVPLAGIVQAGNPLEIFEPLGEEVELPDWMVEQGGGLIGFRVQGQSMKDAYIQEGDVVVVRQTQRAEPGEMVVAYMKRDASITLKRLKREGDTYCLMPENPEFEPIREPFELVGKVIGVLRRYR